MVTFIHTDTVTVSLKRRGWCLFCFCSEEGMTVVQVGGFIVELSW